MLLVAVLKVLLAEARHAVCSNACCDDAWERKRLSYLKGAQNE